MRKTIKFAAAGAAAAFLIKGLDNRLETNYYNIYSKRLPEVFDNFKIAHISDYHNDPILGLKEKIQKEAPEIIVMTGDMTHDKNCSFLPAVELLKSLVKIAPCYMISGNHDIWRSDYNEYVASCRRTGAYFLQNERVAVIKGNQKIYISGMEDVFTKTRMQKTIIKYLKYFSVTDEYQIMLFHRANALDYIKDFGFDLILSGHMHGGQIRIPYIGGIFSPISSLGEGTKMLMPKYFGGCYKSDKSVMIVNRGLGNPMPFPRFFNRPELGIITLNHYYG